jgi:hypothetical protein
MAAGADRAAATLYCNRATTELKPDPGKPYNAVGFLNNGCTAFLIDANHIVAAAHCFVDTTTGAWQPDLRFYPNFHPQRVTANGKQVPRGQVMRTVVGSRAGESVLRAGMDWGIARIDNWKHTTGLDLTPLAMYSGTPTAGMALTNPAYTRHRFPYNDNAMERDTKYCGWVGESAPGKNDGGMWAIRMRPAPIYDGQKSRDRVGCNSRWGAGMMHADCSVREVKDAVVRHNCDTVGGSSGSPLMHKDASGAWSVIGVGHGGGSPATKSSNDFSLLAPVCTQDTPNYSDNIGPSVERFRDAPRFASSVAVHRSPYNASATAVFAIDTDLNRVVWRVRQGDVPKYTGPFGFWKSMGSPYTGAKLTRIAACSADASARPQVFVIAGSAIHARPALASGSWGPWSEIGPPSKGIDFVDIDSISDSEGGCQLFAVATNGRVFTRAKSSGGTWENWSTVAVGPYKKITALSYAKTTWVAMLDKVGDIWRTSLAQAGWSTPTKLSRPPGIAGWRDIDMTWDEEARGFLVAIPARVPVSARNRLWFMPMYGNKAWLDWRFFTTHLWAPGAAPQDAPNLQSVAASRWMEDPAGTTSPVLFATDDTGNVYFIEYARVGTPGWVLDWKSFYHEYIPYK